MYIELITPTVLGVGEEAGRGGGREGRTSQSEVRKSIMVPDSTG